VWDAWREKKKHKTRQASRSSGLQILCYYSLQWKLK
jgi:hypothetical protein